MRLLVRTETRLAEIEYNPDITSVEIFDQITNAKFNEETNELETDETTAKWIIKQITDQNEAYGALCEVSDNPLADWNRAIAELRDYEDVPMLVRDFIETIGNDKMYQVTDENSNIMYICGNCLDRAQADRTAEPWQAIDLYTGDEDGCVEANCYFCEG